MGINKEVEGEEEASSWYGKGLWIFGLILRRDVNPLKGSTDVNCCSLIDFVSLGTGFVILLRGPRTLGILGKCSTYTFSHLWLPVSKSAGLSKAQRHL